MRKPDLIPTAAFLGLFLLVTGGSARAGEADLYLETLHSTVMVVVPQGKTASQGTGWIVDRSRRLAITNRHVVGSQETARVIFPAFQNGQVITDRKYYSKPGRSVEGRVFETSARRDLAVIQLNSIPDDVQQMKLSMRSPKPQDAILLVGNPGSSDVLWRHTVGSVKRVAEGRIKVNLSNELLSARVDVLETQTEMGPGTSGGPVVNQDGQLIGVVTGVANNSRMICIDVSEVKEILGDAYTEMGLQYHNRGNFDRAISDYSAAIYFNPNAAKAYRYRGASKKMLEKYKEAVADCTHAIALDQTSAEAFNERGAAYSFLDEYEKAINDYTQAIQLNPNYALAYRNRASCYVHKGKYEHARADYDEVIRLNPRDAKAYLRRSQVYSELGLEHKSKEDSLKARQLGASLN